MDQVQMIILCQKVDVVIEKHTKHLIEAMPCLCEEKFIEESIRVIDVTCNRCKKLKELN